MSTPGQALKRCRSLVRLVITNARQGQFMQEYATHPATPRSMLSSSPSTRSTLVASSSVEDLFGMPKSSALMSSIGVEDLCISNDVVLIPTGDPFLDDGADNSPIVPSEGVSRLVHSSGLTSLLKMANLSRSMSTQGESEEHILESPKPVPLLSLSLPAGQNQTAGCLKKSDPWERRSPAKSVNLREEADWIMFDQEDPQEAAVWESRPIRPDGSSGKMLPRSMMHLKEGMSVSVFAYDESPAPFNSEAQLLRCRSFECFDKNADISLIPGLQPKRANSPFPSCACTSVSTADELRYAAQIE